jgi:ribonuclease HII
MSSKLRAKASNTSRPDFSFEKAIPGNVCGLDEVGRAPVAGPVVAACVFVLEDKTRKKIWREVNDSKIIPWEKREALAVEIKEHSAWAIGEASIEEIETINIVQASFLAMNRAYEAMQKVFTVEIVTALIDGHIAPKMPCPTKCIVKGDSKSVSIAAASIIAKVYRDDLMAKLGEEHPHYGWEHNAGYPTKKHLNAIQAHGITRFHRKTFTPVRNFIEFGTIEPQLKMAM